MLNPILLDPAPGKRLYDLRPEDLPPPITFWDVVQGAGIVLACAALGAIALMVTARWLRRRTSRARAESARNIGPLVAARSLPFAVCGDCRIVIENADAIACPQCQQASCFVEVRSEDDRGVAAAAVA